MEVTMKSCGIHIQSQVSGISLVPAKALLGVNGTDSMSPIVLTSLKKMLH